MSVTLADVEIRDLDTDLAEAGEDVIIRRLTGTGNQVNVDVTCRAFVRAFQPHELVDTIIQGDSSVIISATQLLASGWPGAGPVPAPGATPDRRVPNSGDKIIIAGRPRTVVAGAPIYLSGQLVRVNLQVRG